MNVKDILEGAEVGEGRVARVIESATSKLPSDLFLWTGLAAIAVAAGSFIAGKKQAGQFVGLWVPTVLLLGVYNKIVKTSGHGASRRSS